MGHGHEALAGIELIGSALPDIVGMLDHSVGYATRVTQHCAVCTNGTVRQTASMHHQPPQASRAAGLGCLCGQCPHSTPHGRASIQPRRSQVGAAWSKQVRPPRRHLLPLRSGSDKPQICCPSTSNKPAGLTLRLNATGSPPPLSAQRARLPGACYCSTCKHPACRW